MQHPPAFGGEAVKQGRVLARIGPQADMELAEGYRHLEAIGKEVNKANVV